MSNKTLVPDRLHGYLLQVIHMLYELISVDDRVVSVEKLDDVAVEIDGKVIAEQLKDHTMHREYIALVCGVLEHDKGKIIAPLARSKDNRLKFEVNTITGKEAVTHFSVLKRFQKYTLIECKLETGRTHQIRVHMEYINHPIVGDPLYGKNNCAIYSKGQLLHAYKLTFIHPITKKEMTFEAPLPDYFKNIIDNLK